MMGPPLLGSSGASVTVTRIPVAGASGFLIGWRGDMHEGPWRCASGSCIQVIASMRAGRIWVVPGGGVHAPGAGLWEQAKPGWRSAADRQ
jgi:hypothetical protein